MAATHHGTTIATGWKNYNRAERGSIDRSERQDPPIGRMPSPPASCSDAAVTCPSGRSARHMLPFCDLSEDWLSSVLTALPRQIDVICGRTNGWQRCSGRRRRLGTGLSLVPLLTIYKHRTMGHSTTKAMRTTLVTRKFKTRVCGCQNPCELHQQRVYRIRFWCF